MFVYCVLYARQVLFFFFESRRGLACVAPPPRRRREKVGRGFLQGFSLPNELREACTVRSFCTP